MADDPKGLLSSNHRRVLLTGFASIDQRLSEALREVGWQSPFSRLSSDLGPADLHAVEEYVREIRRRLVEGLNVLGIEPPRPEVLATSSLGIAPTFAGIALDEMHPKHLAGYGPLDPEAAAVIERIEADIGRVLEALRAYLAQDRRRDLSGRLNRLAQTALNPELLRAVERVVRERSLVEFLPGLDSIVSRLEAPAFEIAVLGRVSSGKSSLLNAILGGNILPTGVTPITAVPVRIVWGAEPSVEIAFARAPTARVPLSDLAGYVTEADNPSNARGVELVTVYVPAAALDKGVVLVDTPGVGSLALSGAKASYAYLPRCDHGVLLLDASSALNEEDLRLLRLLIQAGVGASVLIGKADLLSPDDQERNRAYVRAQVQQTLGLDLTVDAVSAMADSGASVREWFQRSVAPSIERTKEMSLGAMRRKLGAIAEGVIAVLRASSEAPPIAQPAQIASVTRDADDALAEARGEVEQLRSGTDSWIDDIVVRAASLLVGRRVNDSALEEALRMVVHEWAEHQRTQVRERLLYLRDRLAGALTEVSSLVGRRDPGVEDLAPNLVTVPMLMLPETPLSTHTGLAQFLAAVPVIQERRLRAQLRIAIEPLSHALRVYVGRLADWNAAQVRQMDAVFGASTDPMRVHAGGWVDQEAQVAADVDLLERLLGVPSKTFGTGTVLPPSP